MPIVMLIVARPNWTVYSIGLVFVLIGQLIRIWAAGYIRKTEKLAVGGPFAHVRNPLYVGTLTMGLGYCIITNQIWVVPFVLVLYFAVHWPTILKEEGVLAEKFGDDYQRYLTSVPRLLPQLRSYPEASGQFSWNQVWDNHEYRSITGCILAAIFFALHILF